MNVSVACVCSAPNCCDTEQRSASQPGSVASGTHCITYCFLALSTFYFLFSSLRNVPGNYHELCTLLFTHFYPYLSDFTTFFRLLCASGEQFVSSQILVKAKFLTNYIGQGFS